MSALLRRAASMGVGLLGALFAGACGGSESHGSTTAVDGGDAGGPLAGGAPGAAGKGGGSSGGGNTASAGGVTSRGGASGGTGASPSGGASSSAGGAPSSTGGASSSTGGAAASGGAGGASSQGSCDPRRVVCRSAPPSCGTMQVPSVQGNCWGPCVAIDTCTCADAADCPDANQYTCNRSAKHCTPYLE